MKTFFISMILVSLLFPIAGALAAPFVGPSILDAYAVIRLGLCAGLLAIGGFLFTSRATWMARLKEPYEDPDHLHHVKELRLRGLQVSIFGGFERLTRAFHLLSFMVILAGVLQVTLGLRRDYASVGACIGAAIAGLIIFLYLLYRIRRIERAWIRKMEAEQEAKMPSTESFTVSHR